MNAAPANQSGVISLIPQARRVLERCGVFQEAHVIPLRLTFRRQCISAGVLAVGVALGGGLARSPAAPVDQPPTKPTTVTPDCTAGGCHAAVLAHKFLHGPAAGKKCDACHEYDEPREHRFRAVSESDLCARCHPMEHRNVIHKPVRDGQCSACHDPHGSEHRLMLIADPAKGLCISCHIHEESPAEHVHGPVAAGACILCHEPHSSWQPSLLVKSASDLCADCHAEVQQTGVGLHVHAAMEQGCTSCHNPHASLHPYMLHKAADDLCADCHGETMQAIGSAAVVHGAVHEVGGCTQCHSPHSSRLPNLQKHSEPETCLVCHDKPLTTAAGRVLTNMALLLHESPDHHGPIREGSCSSCHQPHAAEHANLLVQTYPPEFYAPFEIDRYALCFTCHMAEMATSKSGTGLTRFRDGDVNLHWLHVNQEKGRTCRACHEVHASKRPFHVRESVPFGSSGWLLEINFEARPDGGFCAPGCHVERAYARGEAQPPAASRDPKGGSR